MIIRNHQLEELEEARRLQDELCRLHVPSPILSWRYKMIDKNGEILEKGVGKSNSYTRNALNWIAWSAGLCDYNVSSAINFGDGTVNVKYTTGAIGNASNLIRYSVATNPTLNVGESTAAESLDSYEIPSSALTPGTTSVGTTFNPTTRKLITTLSCSFTNNSAGAVDVAESAISVRNGSSAYMLCVRDVFSPISVPVGGTLIWTYVTEVAYPEP